MLLYFFNNTHTYDIVLSASLKKKKKNRTQNRSCISLVRPQLGFEFLNPVISPHRHRNGRRSLNASLDSFGRHYSLDSVVGTGRLGRRRSVGSVPVKFCTPLIVVELMVNCSGAIGISLSY